jgi:glycosyltransferase involved in cell wall biosynthesis
MRIQTPVNILNYSLGSAVNCTYRATADTTADVNVFSKHFDQPATLLAMSSKEDFGFKAVFDVCDDHFDREDGSFYEKMIDAADLITCNSANMQARIYEVTGKLARIIPDPITFPDSPFKKYAKGGTPRVLWYGHNSNLGSLAAVTSKNTTPVTAYCNKLYKGLKNIKVLLWDLGVVEGAIGDYDVVVLPTQEHPWAKCKSPNRAVDALAAGKLVITDTADVYEDLKNFVMIVPDLGVRPGALDEALEWWSTHPAEVEAMIVNGQKHIKKMYSSEKILEGWLKVLQDLAFIEEYSDCA